jgi:hypothetical protein
MSNDVSEVRVASIIRMMMEALIALMMESARTSETSVDFQLRTRQYIPENSELGFSWLIIWTGGGLL